MVQVPPLFVHSGVESNASCFCSRDFQREPGEDVQRVHAVQSQSAAGGRRVWVRVVDLQELGVSARRECCKCCIYHEYHTIIRCISCTVFTFFHLVLITCICTSQNVRSDGEGCGSTFFVEFPIYYKSREEESTAAVDSYQLFDAPAPSPSLTSRDMVLRRIAGEARVFPANEAGDFDTIDIENGMVPQQPRILIVDDSSANR